MKSNTFNKNLLLLLVILLFASLSADTALAGKDAGKFALHKAVEDGDIGKVKALIAGGADVNTSNDKEETPLYIAAGGGHKAIVELLIAKGADIEAGEKKLGLTPLHVAAFEGRLGMVKLLIDEGANVNAKNKARGWTVLHMAASSGHKDVAELLIAEGADIHAKGTFVGMTPLSLAVASGQNEMAKFLIAKGSKVDILVASGMGDIESVRAFLAKNPTLINATQQGDFTPLHQAAYCGQIKMAKFLIEKGANVNAGYPEKPTPLYWAARKGNLDAAKLLVDKGADVNIRIKHGWTILHSVGTLETARLLVDNGADVNAKDDHGITPLHNIAGKGGLYTVQKVLSWKNGGTFRTRETDFEKHRNEAEKITAEIARLLINNGADVNAKDNKGKTPLDIAEQAGNKEVAELLLKHQVKNAAE